MRHNGRVGRGVFLSRRSRQHGLRPRGSGPGPAVVAPSGRRRKRPPTAARRCAGPPKIGAAMNRVCRRSLVERFHLGLGRHPRRPGRRARRRSADRRPPAARAEHARGRHLGRLLRRPGAALRRRRLAHLGRQARRRVLHRLADRVQPVGRQPLRLRDHHGPVRRAPAVPAEGAAHRHRAGAGHARRVHRGRRRPDRAVLLGLLHLRRVPGLHRDHAVQAGRERRGRLQGEHPHPLVEAGAADLLVVRRAAR